jgi:peptide deformylase
MDSTTLNSKTAPSIVLWPTAILSQVAEPFDEAYDFDELEEARELARMMFEALQGKGIGLAAPQIGVSKRLIIGNCNQGAQQWRFALINPEIVKASDQTCTYEEGCLSVPKLRLKVQRPKQVTVKGINLRGEPTKIKARGLLAACLQHEIDHLNGITLANRGE